MDSLFVVRNEDGPWPEDVMRNMVADTPHFRYLMAQSARGEAIKLLEKATDQNTKREEAVLLDSMAKTWVELANATEMDLYPTEYQNRRPRYDNEPQDGVNNV